MKPVERSELVDYQTYNDSRAETRAKVLAAKAPRRIVVGDYLCFLFENRDTVRYQVQEMMRTERIVREADIAHELATYNELLGGPGELGCTLLVTIDDPEERDQKLTAWLGLNEHIYAKLEDGTKVHPTYDERQVGETRLSSVQYFKFKVGDKAPVALGVDMRGDDPNLADHGLQVEHQLDEEQRAALQADLDAE